MLKNLINIIKNSFKPIRLNQVIFFVTGQCNLRCQHCFYWRNLGSKKDLRYQEIAKISKNLPQFNFLLLSGGEPFLRKDLVKIVRLFRINNCVLAVGIPTNGVLTKTIIKQTEKILKIDPLLMVYLYFSLDGTQNVHERIRKTKGCFRKTLRTIKQIKKLKKKYNNLSININTVISQGNIDNIKQLTDFIFSQRKNFIDGHYFEIIRGSPPNPRIKKISQKKIKLLYEKTILSYQEKLWRQRKGSKIANLFWANLAKTNFSFIYKTQYENFFENQPWPMPCLAGQSVIVINHKGELQLCELRKPIADLKKENYDIARILKGKRFKQELEKIKKEKCFCTHVCFLTESMYKSLKVVLKQLPILWFKNLSDHFH